MLKTVLGLTMACVGGGLIQPPPSVPASLLGAAALPPIEFTVLLAEASVPAGLEIRESDASRTRAVTYSDTGVKKATAAELVTAFNKAHSDYRASVFDGVLVVRPVTDNATFLDQPSSIVSPMPITGRMTAARQIFSPLEPGLASDVILNSLGYEGEEDPIVLDGTGGRKVINTLNQIVTQSLSAWQVTTRKVGSHSQVIEFGFIRRDGSNSMHALRTQPSGE